MTLKTWRFLALSTEILQTYEAYTAIIGLPEVAVFIIIFSYALQSLRLIVRSRLDVPTFNHQASPRVSPRESTQRRKVELWARNVREFCLNADFHVTFRDLLHAVKLRHGTDGFTSPPKEGVLRIVSL
jgi:hypothetical protein